MRVPGWADRATYSVGIDGSASGSTQSAANGTLVRAECAAGSRLTLRLDLNPTVRVETGWGGKSGRRTNPLTKVDAGGYSRWVGSMPAGGDLHVAHNMSLEEAEAWCNTSTACIGFTMQPPPIVHTSRQEADEANEAERRAAAAEAAEAATAVVDQQIQAHEHGHHHHDHQHAHAHVEVPLHGYGQGQGGRENGRVRAPPLPPAPPAPLHVYRAPAEGGSDVAGPPPPLLSTVYFKQAFNPNNDKRWLSYAKAWDVHDTNALAVLRGPVLYALRLRQVSAVVKTWQPYGNTDINISTPSVWSYALLLNTSDVASSFTFERVPPQRGVAFNSSAPALILHASAAKIGEWRSALDAADEPPPSPMAQPVGIDGTVEKVELVPYGATELRMSALPWVAM